MNKSAPEIIQLRQDVEARAGIHPSTPADFETLIALIWNQLHENIALSTLERLWGYVDGANNTRNIERGSSNPFIGEGIHTQDLTPGRQIEVTWLPNRRCVFRYLGDMRFEVVESVNSKLQVGSTFLTTFFLKGQPLYMDQLTQSGQSPVSYVAGNNGGLQSVVLK